MARIYLSYRRDDAELARALQRALISAGHRVVEDPTAAPRVGESIREAFLQRLADADWLLVALGAETWTSDWVRWEVALWPRRDRLLVVRLARDVRMPGELVGARVVDVDAAPGTGPAALDRLAGRVLLALDGGGSDRVIRPPLDLVLIGAGRHAAALAAALRPVLESAIPIGRCWGSGTAGAPLAMFAFADPDVSRLDEVAAGVRRATRPKLRTVASLMFGRSGGTGHRERLLRVLFGSSESEGNVARPAVIADLARRGRPADWLQFVVLDLCLRRPALVPRSLLAMGHDDLACDLSTALGAAIGHVGLPTVTITDTAGFDHELTQYPLSTIPWSMVGESPPHPTLVLRVASEPTVQPDFEPRRPPGWKIIDVPTEIGGPDALWHDLSAEVAA